MSEGNNFIAFKATAETGATITVKAGSKDPKELDSDGIVVMQLTEEVDEITLTASKGGKMEVKRYILGITKEAE